MAAGEIWAKVLALGAQEIYNLDTVEKKRKLLEFSLFLLMWFLVGEVPAVNFL